MNALATLDKEVSRNYYDNFDWIIEYPNSLSNKEVLILANIVNPIESNPPNEMNKITLIGEYSLLLTVQENLIKDENLLVSFSHANYFDQNINLFRREFGIHVLKLLTYEIPKIFYNFLL